MPAVIPLIIWGVGTGIQAFSQYKAGKKAEAQAQEVGTHQKEASESQAQLAEYNAAVAELQAKDALERGAEDESRFRTQVRGLIGTQRTEIAAGNIDVGFGSAVDVQADAAYLGELDALQIQHNAQREAWGFQQNAEDLRKRGEIARKEGVYLEKAGQEYRSGAGLQLAGTLLGSAGSLLLQKYGFRNPSPAPAPKPTYEPGSGQPPWR